MEEQSKNDDLDLDPLSDDLDLSMDELDLAPLDAGDDSESFTSSDMGDFAFDSSDSENLNTPLDELDLSPAEEPSIDELDLSPADSADMDELDLSPVGEDSLNELELAPETAADSPGDDGLFDSELGLDLEEKTTLDEKSASPPPPEAEALDDEEVTLSADELDNILNTSDDSLFQDMEDDGSLPEGVDPEEHAMVLEESPKQEEELPPLEPIEPASSLDLTEGEDEPIALSSDELDNILEDVDMEGTLEGESMLEEELPDLELEEPPAVSDRKSDSVASVSTEKADAIDEEIALSDDELSEVLLDESTGPLTDALPENPSLASLEMDEEDDSIALTPEELGNIVSEVDTDEVIEAEGQTPDEDVFFDEPPLPELDDSDMPVVDGAPPEGLSLDAGENDESIALSPDELGNILEDVEDEPIEAEGLSLDEDGIESSISDETVESSESSESSLGASDELSGDLSFEEREIINLDEYDEHDEESALASDDTKHKEKEEESADTSTALAPAATAIADTVAEEQGINKDEMRKMISYLDRLFDQLPEETIREFSKSEYFDLYKKIMTDLGL